MKLKFKLSAIVVAIMVTVVGGLTALILAQASSVIRRVSLESAQRLASQQATYWEGREEGYLRVATVTAGYMSDYEGTEPERRRRRFDQFLMATLTTESNLEGIFAVFKPNALDGMDSQFRGTPGSTAEGVYAPWYTRRSGAIEYLTYERVADAQAFLNGPGARNQVLMDPELQMVAGRQAHTFCMFVPIIAKNNEVIGLVGLDIGIDAVQGIVEETLKNYADISALEVYSGNGTIMGHTDKNRVGMNMQEADAALFNGVVNEAADAIKNGKLYETEQYSPLLKTKLEIVLYPLTIGETGSSWSVMVGVTEKDILDEIYKLIRIIVIVSVIVVIVVTVIIFFMMNSVTKPIVNVAATLKDISEGEGDLTKSVEVYSKDEIGDLGRYFNATLEKIKALIIIIK
ncbi:MAG: HAMP domain-containing protein, partial [Spirochaetaceae bacterium]|nr:HAMP domain-containing protein [Spirochaetaceae bacterium]